MELPTSSPCSNSRKKSQNHGVEPPGLLLLCSGHCQRPCDEVFPRRHDGGRLPSECSASLLNNQDGALSVTVDYVLMDPAERKRLFIESVPRAFPQRVIRGPVPWHPTYQHARKWNREHLHTVNPMTLRLEELWFSE